MSSYYSEHILPALLDRVMEGERFQNRRRTVVSDARGRILEIGFGSGKNLPFYPPRVQSLAAIDPSRELFNRSAECIRASGIDIVFHEASAERLPFAANSFDTVVSTWTLCSIPDVDLALDEIRRILAPGGFFLFAEHGRHPSEPWRSMQRLLTPAWKRLSGGCHLDRDIPKLLERHGMTTVFAPPEDDRLVHMFQGKATSRRAGGGTST